MRAEDDLTAAVRAALAEVAAVDEVKMFGGTSFMLAGHMVAAASRRGLLLRLGKAAQDDALAQPGVRPMETRGRVLEGYVRVEAGALTDMALRSWLALALEYVGTLPPKVPGSPKRKKGKTP
jgi:TfoX/Sxy family transcriptional regulator of competence genes